MICENTPKYPLQKRVFHPHFENVGEFSETRTRGISISQLRGAYSFDNSRTGKNMKIAIVGALDNVAIKEDMRVFCEEFSLPVPSMSVYYPFGRAQNSAREWQTESCLDTQYSHVFAPEAEIIVAFSPDSSTESMLRVASYCAEALRADVVSMSFGAVEGANDNENARFFENSDSIFVASSGDVGGVVSFPSSSDNCISVGGTSLRFLGGGGSDVFESAWKNAGAGESDVFEIPEWQGDFANIKSASRGMRATPDVAFCANCSSGVAVYSSALGGWTTVRGTSVGAACFAGICASIKSGNEKIRTSADMLRFLYGKAGKTHYCIPQYSFRDIVVGSCGTFRAEVGWDMASGLGSPNIRELS